MNNIYRLLYSGGLVMAIFFFVLTIFLFVWFNIPKVFDDLTGRSKKKGIRSIRNGDDFVHAASKREMDKYYRGKSEKIRVKEAASSPAFTDKAKKDRTSGLLKSKKKSDDTSSILGDTSENLKFELSENLSKSDTNVDFKVENTDPETGLLYSGELGEAFLGLDKPSERNEGYDISEAETSVLDTDNSETTILNEEAASEEDEFSTTVLSGENAEAIDEMFANGETSVLETKDSITYSDVEVAKFVSAGNASEADTSVLIEDNQDTVSMVKYIYNIVVVNSDETI